MSDEARIAHFIAERDRAREVISKIDTAGWRFYEALGDAPMQEVTAGRRAECVAMAEMMDRLIVAWEKL